MSLSARLVILVSTPDVGGSVAVVWDFETDPEYQEKLDWVEEFMVNELEPLDLVALDPYDKKNAETMAVLRPLQQQVKEHGLWAAHLRPELGGQGYGQVKLALLNEILGRSRWAPSVFGCQAPDSGNAEILAMFGTPEQKARYLQPLLDGEIISLLFDDRTARRRDPELFLTRAERDNATWVINGEKWFSTNARHASFFIVMAVTNPEARTRDKMSLFIVPAEAPGIEIIRNVGVGTDFDHATHGYVRYDDVRVPGDHILGGEGQAFASHKPAWAVAASTTPCALSRWSRRAFDMMCERAVSRQTRNRSVSELSDDPRENRRQLDPDRAVPIAGAAHGMADRQAPRLPEGAHAISRRSRSRCRKVLHDVVQRAMHLHGALGVPTRCRSSR